MWYYCGAGLATMFQQRDKRQHDNICFRAYVTITNKLPLGVKMDFFSFFLKIWSFICQSNVEIVARNSV